MSKLYQQKIWNHKATSTRFQLTEKIRRKPIKAKTEGMINSIGFILLMLLMVFVTISDVIKLF